jgi:GTP-binding protein
MITDEATIEISAGHGGPGKASFYTRQHGPDGGDGGRGGDLYFTGTSDLFTLNRYTSKKSFAATNGDPGGKNLQTGHDGEDLTLEVPIGTEITDLETQEKWEITRLGEKILIARGGIGGLGNASRKSAKLTTPLYAQHGLRGKKRTLKLNLKLIADYGLIGLPNTGKSSLLNALTKANAKVGDYAFTTLEPNLGVVVVNGANKVIADIPGLIEGASTGKGLGMRFLKHVEKVPFIFHCISVNSPFPLFDYRTVRDELKAYDKKILEKKEVILLTKTDTVTKEELEFKKKELLKTKKKVIPVSILDSKSIDKIKQIIQTI